MRKNTTTQSSIIPLIVFIIIVITISEIADATLDRASHYKIKNILTHYQTIIFYVAFFLISILSYYLIKIKVRISKEEKARKGKQELYKLLDVSNKENQLRFITDDNVKFKRYSPINGEVCKAVFYPVENFIKQNYKGYRIFAETNFGAFIEVESKYAQNEEKARASINSKRLDFLIIDSDGKPALAIEYHGSGHYGKNEKERQDVERNDKVKRTALQLAGVKLLEVPENRDKTKLLYDVDNYLKLYNSIKNS